MVDTFNFLAGFFLFFYGLFLLIFPKEVLDFENRFYYGLFRAKIIYTKKTLKSYRVGGIIFSLFGLVFLVFSFI